MKADPIFALIEAHKAAKASWEVVLHEYTPIETALRAQGLKPSQEDKHPLMVAHQKRYNETHRVMDRAESKLCRTKPTTLAGLAAVTLYLGSQWDDGVSVSIDRDDFNAFTRTTAAAIEAITARETRDNIVSFKPRKKAA